MTTRRHFSAVWLVGSATALSLLGDQALYAVLPTEYERLGLLPFHVGLLLSMNRWIRFFTNSLAAWALGRYSVRWRFAAGCLLGSLTTLAYALRPGFGWFLLARATWGLCWSFIRHSGIAEVTAQARVGTEGRNIGIYNGIARIGSLVGNALGGALLDLSGWGWTFLAMGLTSVGAVPIAAALPAPASEPPPAVEKRSRWRHLAVIAWAGWVVGCVGPGIVMSSLGVLLTERIGRSWTIAGLVLGVTTLNGLLLASRWVLEGIGAPIFGAASDRYGRRRVARWCFVGGALCLFLLGRTIPPGVLIVAVVGFFAAATALNTVLSSEAAVRGAAPLAAFVTGSDLGSASGPLLAWSMLQLEFPPAAALTVGVLLYSLGWALSPWFFLRHPFPTGTSSGKL